MAQIKSLFLLARLFSHNHLSGQRFDQATPFETLWFQFAAVEGDEDRLASGYRRFVLERLTGNRASRLRYSFTTRGHSRSATSGGTAGPTSIP